jgi:hypothetical protein
VTVRRAFELCGLVLAGCFDALGSYGDAGAPPANDRDVTTGVAGSDVGGGDAGGADAGGGALGLVERCDDAADGDSDGLVDCEDPDCTGYVCVGVPTGLDGWDGPFELAQSGASCSPAWPESQPVHELIDTGDPCG